ncbi:MAG: DUF2975 domain-containing protein [Acidimicrobiales bacterium]
MTTRLRVAPLRILDVILRVARALLLLATILFVALTVVGLFVTTSVSLEGSTDEPELTYTDNAGNAITIDGATQTISSNDRTSADEIPRFGATEVTIDLERRTPRTAAMAFAGAWFVLAWVAVTNVQGITRTTLIGDAFSHENARRLGRIGGATLIYAVLGTAMPRVMDALLDDATLPVDGFHTRSQISDPWAWVVVGLLLLTIGRAFERGVELEALDAATI